MKIFLKDFKRKIKTFFLPSILTCTMLYISSGSSALSIEMINNESSKNCIQPKKECLEIPKPCCPENLKVPETDSKKKLSKIIEKVNKAYLEISEYGNFENFSASERGTKYFEDFSLMFPIVETNHSVIFGDVRSSVANNSNYQNFSAGLGLRFNPEFKKDFIFGLNTYVDYFSSEISKNFSQFGFGAEIIHKKFEVRANIYKNISDEYYKAVFSSIPANPEVSGINIRDGAMFVKLEIPGGSGITTVENRMFNEIDYEIGYNLNKNITVYGGGFFAWDNETEQKFAGPRFKIKASGKLNEKTELYGKLETKTNTVNSISSSKTNFEASAHLRFELQSDSQKTKLKNLRSKHKKKIINPTSESNQKSIQEFGQQQKRSRDLLKVPVFRRHHIELQSIQSFRGFDGAETRVLSIGNEVFDHYSDISDDFTQDKIPENAKKPIFFFNLNAGAPTPVNIDEPLNFDSTPTIIGDTSTCPDPSLCAPGTNLFNLQTELGDFDIPIPTNGNQPQQFNMGPNSELNFNNDGNLFGGNFAPSPGARTPRVLTFLNTNISGTGDSKISSVTKNGQKIVVKKTGGSFNVNNSNFINSIIEIPEKFNDSSGASVNTVLNKIDIQNNNFSINPGEEYSIIDTIFAPTSIQNFIIKGNSFRGSNADIKIRKNKDLNFANNFVANNKINGRSNSDALIQNPLRNIEFIDPIIPPILNKPVISANSQEAFPSIQVFDRLTGQIKIKKDSIETIFADFNNSATAINSFESDLIQFIDKRTNDFSSSTINLSGNITFKDNAVIFGKGSNDLSDLTNITDNDSNFDVSYKVFTNKAGADNDIINPALQTEKLNFSKPNISISNGGRINFGNLSQMFGLNFNLSGVTTNNIFNLINIKNFQCEKNNFLNWSGQGSGSSRFSLFNLTDNSTDFGVNPPLKNAGHKFFNNIFTVSETARFSNVFNFQEKTNYNFNVLGAQLNGSMEIRNNEFTMGANASSNFNHFIYVTPDIFNDPNNPDNPNNGKQRLITFDIRQALRKFYNNANVCIINGQQGVDTRSSKVLEVLTRDIKEYTNVTPFTAYFQLEPHDKENFIFNFLNKDKVNQDYSIADIITKTNDGSGGRLIDSIAGGFSFTLPENSEISFGINNRWTSRAVGNQPNLEGVLVQSQEITFGQNDGSVVVPNNHGQTNSNGNFFDYVTNARFSDAKDFDRLIKVNLNNGDNLNQKLQEARNQYPDDINKRYLFLLDDIKSNITINLSAEERDENGNTIANDFLRDGEYLIGQNYKFWVSTPNETQPRIFPPNFLNQNILNDIVNFDSDDFDHNKVIINAQAKTIENQGGFEPIYNLKNRIGIIGLNFKLSVDNEENLLNFPRPNNANIEGNSGADLRSFYFPQKKNSFFTQLESNSSLRKLIQDNIFEINAGRLDKDYINIFDFQNNTDQDINRNSVIYDYNLNQKYKIYNNKFDFKKSRGRVINSYFSYVTPVKNQINFSDSSSNIDLINIQNEKFPPTSKRSQTQVINQYNLFNGTTVLQNFPNNNFIGNNPFIIEDKDIDILKQKNIGLVSLENHIFLNPQISNSFTNLKDFFLEDKKLEKQLDDQGRVIEYKLNFIDFPYAQIIQGTSTQQIQSKAINIFLNKDSVNRIRSKSSIFLTGSNNQIQLLDDVVLASTNSLQPELSISATNFFSNSSFGVVKNYPLCFIYQNIDTAMNIVPSDNFSNPQNNEFQFNFSDENNNAIISLGKNNIISGIDIKGAKTYQFSVDCGSTTVNAFQTTCSNCLNPIDCSTDPLKPGCPTCSGNDKFTITSIPEGQSGFVFKFQNNDNESRIQNSNIDLNLNLNSINLTNYPEKIIDSPTISNNRNWELFLRNSPGKATTHNFQHLVKLDKNNDLTKQINDAPRNSLIVLEDDLVLNHDSKLDLKNKTLISGNVFRNVKFIGEDSEILKNSDQNSIKSGKKPKIFISEDKNNKLFINDSLFEIDENTIISGLDFKINASSLDSSKEDNALFKFKSNKIKNSANNDNLKIINNNFDFDLSGGLKLFDSELIRSETLKENKFQGKFEENSFFFPYNPSNLDELEEKYMQFNLLNKNYINNCDLKINQEDLIKNHEKINLGIIFENKEYNALENLATKNNLEDLGLSSRKTLFFSKENLILKNQKIDLGEGSNGILSGDGESYLNLKIKPKKSLSSNKLNIELEIKPGTIDLISEKNEPIIKGQNYDLYDLNFEIYNNSKKDDEEFFLLEGKPRKLTNNVFNLKNSSENQNMEKIIKDNLREFINFKILKDDQENQIYKGEFKNNYLILK